MFGKMWFHHSDIRQGFVMQFKNGYKVVVEYLKEEQEATLQSIADKKEYIEKISWDGIANWIEESKNSEGDNVGCSFDVMVYNQKNKLVRLPKWNKNTQFKSGVDLDEVIDILYIIKKRSLK